ELVARRVGFAGSDPASQFSSSLELHTGNVRRIYDRLFGNIETGKEPSLVASENGLESKRVLGKEAAAAIAAGRVLAVNLDETEFGKITPAELATKLQTDANKSLNPGHSLLHVSRIAASLEKSDMRLQISRQNLSALIELCGVSEFFGAMIASNPRLI